MGESASPFGGWLVGSAARLADREDVSLAIAYPGPKNGTWRGINTTYYQFRRLASTPKHEGWFPDDFGDLVNWVRPDLVHIFGTEFGQTLAMVNACIAHRVPFVISVQGLVSVIATHYTLGLPPEVQSRYTVRDLLRHDNIRRQQMKLAERGRFEITAIRKARHVIGRTAWDQACVGRLNPAAVYHHCNEILRSEFYEGTWNMRNCRKSTLFVAQAGYPIKGLHLLLEAFVEVACDFPDASLVIGGVPVVGSGVRGRVMQSSYGAYIGDLIRRYRLRQRIRFTGLLGPTEMKGELLGANAFILPSTIENSPNSLGEAMLLGMPVVASYVGGIPDFIHHGVDGFLYQADAPYMLAHYIKRTFSEPAEAERMALRARKLASERFDSARNTEQLLSIYGEVMHD